MMSSSFSVSRKNSGRRADTWDPETLSIEAASGGDNGGFTSKLSSKMSQQFEAIKVGFRRIKESEKLDKIMVLSSKGVEKVKDGAYSGFQWIKDKCRNTAHNSRVVIVGFRRIKESQKVDKIMVLSSKGVEKVKDGACSGFRWIKDNWTLYDISDLFRCPSLDGFVI
nr:uncharacterized protein LOC104233217 [Ipomoea batatas]